MKIDRQAKIAIVINVAFLVLGAGIGAIVLVSMNDEPSSDAGKPTIVDEPAGTKVAEGECLVYEDGRLEKVPEGSVQTCSVDGARGICAIGTSTCLNREWTVCKSQYVSIDETCNGLDDDCDGQVDEEVCPGPVETLFLNPASPFWIGP